MNCLICGFDKSKVVYNGIIRDGKFGNYTNHNVDIYKCEKCGVMYHIDLNKNIPDFYTSDAYRTKMGQTVDQYETIHDKEVLDKLNYTGTTIFRNKIVADIGCGGGSFLDYIKGVASDIIAIEPTHDFHKKLKTKGYNVYSYISDAMQYYKNKVDIITSFDVIEHVENPLIFMKDCYNLCSNGGKIIIGTPTEQPIMRMALEEEYDKFLFSTQHLWVLNKQSMIIAAEKAGFLNIRIEYKQRYGLGNLIAWLKYKKPMGNIDCDFISDTISKAWIVNSEERELSDYIVLYAEK